MSNAKLWRCVRCKGETVQPRVVRGRRGGWLCTSRCRRCRVTNFHNKRADWIKVATLWRQIGVQASPEYLKDSWQNIKKGLVSPSPAKKGDSPHANRKRSLSFSLSSNDEFIQHKPKTLALPEKVEVAHMKRSEAFPSKYLKADDVNGEDIAATISSLEWEEIGKDKTSKPVLYFRGKLKPLILNGTNWDKIVEVTGEDDSDEWEGKKITLYSMEVPFGRDMVNAIRVRGLSKAAPKKGKPDAGAPLDDDNVPF
jgi:hypothetical protein